MTPSRRASPKVCLRSDGEELTALLKGNASVGRGESNGAERPFLSCLYSPECVEEEFSEVRGSKRLIGRSGRRSTAASWDP
jgi:hypothetical protein